MKKVSLKLDKKDVGEIMLLGKNVAKGMDGNAKFPSPPVVPAELDAASDELAEAMQEVERTRSIQAYTDQAVKLGKVSKMLRDMASYVDSVASGDVEVIRSANMPVSKTREKQPAPGQARDVVADFTGIPGSIVLRWSRPHYARLFRVYMTETPDNNASWMLIDTITVRKLMVQGLASGKRFYFKIVSVGTAGVGPDSEIAEALAA